MPHDSYKETLSEARTGIALNNQEFYENDRIISEGIWNSQHSLQPIFRTKSMLNLLVVLCAKVRLKTIIV
jgi:hypothetical protein